MFGDDEKPPVKSDTVELAGSGNDEDDSLNLGKSGDTDDNDDEVWNRAVYYTKTFGTEAAMNALVLAIRSGSNESSPKCSVERRRRQSVLRHSERKGPSYTNIPEAIKSDYYTFQISPQIRAFCVGNVAWQQRSSVSRKQQVRRGMHGQVLSH